jgi:hypothetical protein
MGIQTIEGEAVCVGLLLLFSMGIFRLIVTSKVRYRSQNALKLKGGADRKLDTDGVLKGAAKSVFGRPEKTCPAVE